MFADISPTPRAPCRLQGTTHCLYKGDQLLTTGTGVNPLYHWTAARFGRLLRADEIQMAKSHLKPKAERELKKHAKEIEKAGHELPRSTRGYDSRHGCW